MKKALSILLLLLMCLSLVPASAFISLGAGTEIKDNLWDFNTSYCGYYNEKGAKFFSLSLQTSADIAVNEGDTLTFGPVYSGQELYVMTLDKSDKLLKRVTDLSELEKVATFEDGPYICSFKVPAGVSFVRISCRTLVFNTFVITKNAAFDIASYNAYIKSIGKEKYAEFRAADKSSFAGKSLHWCGDSVGAGSYEHYYPGTDKAGITAKTQKPSWAGRMASLFNLGAYSNSSKGGSTYSTKHPNTNIPTQALQNAAGKDIVVIEGGTVDCGGYNSIVVPLGYLSDGYELSDFAGENTFIGGVERAFYYATKNAPDAIIVCVIPYSAPSNKNYNYGWERLYQYIPYVCEKWGIPCINLYKNDEVNCWFDYDRTVGGAYYYDNLHCSPLGYTATSLEVAMGIYSAGKYDASKRHMPENIPYLITKEATGEPEFTGKYIVCPENLFSKATASRGTPKVGASGYENQDKYLTSDYIEVKAGDTLYFGPCSPYETLQLVGYSEKDQTKSVTGAVNSDKLATAGFFNNSYIIYQYTVPDGVSYVRCSFLIKKAPMITLNQPFDIYFYNKALTAANNGETIDFALTEAPVTTVEVVTEPEPVPTEAPEQTTASPVTEPDTEPAETSGCASFTLPVFLPVMLLPLFLRKKKD